MLLRIYNAPEDSGYHDGDLVELTPDEYRYLLSRGAGFIIEEAVVRPPENMMIVRRCHGTCTVRRTVV